MASVLPILATVLAVLAVIDVNASQDRDKRFSWNPIAAVSDAASSAIDAVGLGAVNPIKLGSKLVGASMGTMGLFWGQQENKKCYYHWGLGFSGPESWNPERWNGEKWGKDEEGGLFNGISDMIGVGFTAFFHAWENEEMRAQTCKMLGMGYSTQQPGFRSMPGTCPQGPDCHGTPGQATQPRPGQPIPGMPGSKVVYMIPNQPGEVPERTPGSVLTIVTPGQPPIYLEGSPTTTTTITTIQGNPNPTQYYQQTGSPGFITTTIDQGRPPQYYEQPGKPGFITTTIDQGRPPQYYEQPGKPGYTITTVNEGRPPQYIQEPPYTTSYTTVQQPQQMCPCPCNG